MHVCTTSQGRNEVYRIRDHSPRDRDQRVSIDSTINIHWDQQNFVGSGIKIFITFGIRD